MPCQFLGPNEAIETVSKHDVDGEQADLDIVDGGQREGHLLQLAHQVETAVLVLPLEGGVSNTEWYILSHLVELLDPPETQSALALVLLQRGPGERAHGALADEPVAPHEVGPPGLPGPHHVVREVAHGDLLHSG